MIEMLSPIVQTLKSVEYIAIASPSPQHPLVVAHLNAQLQRLVTQIVWIHSHHVLQHRPRLLDPGPNLNGVFSGYALVVQCLLDISEHNVCVHLNNPLLHEMLTLLPHHFLNKTLFQCGLQIQQFLQFRIQLHHDCPIFVPDVLQLVQNDPYAPLTPQHDIFLFLNDPFNMLWIDFVFGVVEGNEVSCVTQGMRTEGINVLEFVFWIEREFLVQFDEVFLDVGRVFLDWC
mmetsp:Transcript_8288/g.30595  ORF Transcript_8288/g.30595 Transcript_8288/m.30595 type:complete len:230 (-) Transcript_8288:119-808(-)